MTWKPWTPAGIAAAKKILLAAVVIWAAVKLGKT